MKRASGIVLVNKEKFLFYLRDNKATIPYPNYWGLIGGEIEKNETPLQALEREIKEEIDCEIKNIEFVRKIITKNDQNIIFIFKGDIKEEIEKINLTEGQKLRYFSFHELETLKIIPILKEYILKNKEKFI